MNTDYQKVIEANIALHTKMSNDYSTCEPHFRTENIKNVEQKFHKAVALAKNCDRMLDLGCGTGFMINIGKNHVSEIDGVDVTQAMMDKVDKSGNAKITLHNCDTGTFQAQENSYDIVTAYSFLHHLYDVNPTISTAFRALKKGGVFYADLDPNYYFWEGVNKLERGGNYNHIVSREIEMVTFKDEDIEQNFGVEKDTFNAAEYGKNIKGGFKEEELKEKLLTAGFSKVEFFYEWYIGQGKIINDKNLDESKRFENAEIINKLLQDAMPLSRNLFKYIGFYAIK